MSNLHIEKLAQVQEPVYLRPPRRQAGPFKLKRQKNGLSLRSILRENKLMHILSIAINLFFLHIRKKVLGFAMGTRRLEENKSATLELWNFFRMFFFVAEHLSILI